jgi:calcium binding protein 39
VGDAEHDPSSDVVAQVANEVYGQDLLSLLVTHLGQFDFEVNQLTCPWNPTRADDQARKDTSTIYSALLRRQIGSRLPTVEFIAGRPDIIFNTLKG